MAKDNTMLYLFLFGILIALIVVAVVVVMPKGEAEDKRFRCPPYTPPLECPTSFAVRPHETLKDEVTGEACMVAYCQTREELKEIQAIPVGGRCTPFLDDNCASPSECDLFSRTCRLPNVCILRGESCTPFLDDNCCGSATCNFGLLESNCR